MEKKLSPEQRARKIWGHKRGRMPWQLMATRAAFRLLGPVLPGRMSRLAFDLWFRTRRYPEPAREALLLSRADKIELEYAGQPLAAYSWGEGPAVLLVHGWNGRAGQMGPIAKALVAQGYRAVAFDAPAHGRTPGKSTNIFRIAEAMRIVADAAGPLHGVVAHSIGVAATIAALGDGLRSESVIGIAPPSGVDSLLEKYQKLFALPNGVVSRLQARLDEHLGANFRERLSASTVTRSNPVPALIIHDREDPYVPWQEGRSIADGWRGARLQLTDGLGHTRILRNRDVIADILDFIGNRSRFDMAAGA